MQLTTQIKVPKFPTITHSAKVMILGSCFSSCIAEKLEQLRFEVISNPFGISYNPISIANTLKRLTFGTRFTSEELQEHNGLYYSPDHHGKFSSTSKVQTLDNINTQYDKASTAIKSTTHFIITLGSSVVYERDGKIWNNCHKLPQNLFCKHRLSVDEVTEALSPIIEQYKESKFILTVSPIRYMTDNNSVNKATLLLAVEILCKTFDNAVYFPAYEILLDELRDYRFYGDDMLHPSALAEDIIFDRFAESYFTKNTLALNKAITKLTAMQAHRPLHPETDEYIRFKSQLQEYEKIVSNALVSSRHSYDDSPIS